MWISAGIGLHAALNFKSGSQSPWGNPIYLLLRGPCSAPIVGGCVVDEEHRPILHPSPASDGRANHWLHLQITARSTRSEIRSSVGSENLQLTLLEHVEGRTRLRYLSAGGNGAKEQRQENGINVDQPWSL